MKKKLPILLLLCLALFIHVLSGQPPREQVQVIVTPDHEDWNYKIGEKVEFEVMVYQYNTPLDEIEVSYEVMPEKMPARSQNTKKLKNGKLKIQAGTLDEPGFLRCWAHVNVDGKQYTGMATAAFQPLDITPVTNQPSDFNDYWEQAKEALAKIPMDAEITLLPERCTEKVNVYHLSLANYPARSRVYGILSVPKASGKYPAILRVPGAGVRPYYGDVSTAEEGIITLQIGIHGIPVNLDPKVYDNLRYGALNGYWNANLDQKDNYYYKRVYLGCVRAIDYLFDHSSFDGENLAVAGGSQGGALSIITAGLDKRVKYIAPYYPALADLTGYLDDRAGGWPHMFNQEENRTEDNINTSKYYDVVNFAREVEAEGYYSWGYNDVVCPPTTCYAAYNVVEAPKKLLIAYDTGHWSYPEQRDKTESWLLEKLLGKR